MPVNDLTPTTSIESASQFHAVSWAEVAIDTNPKNGEIYKQGSKGYGEDKVDYYSLSNVALARLMNAAGISEVSSTRTDSREHPHICAWQFTAKYVQPDSTVLTYSADYELDLRDYIHVNGSTYRGARFEKTLVDERVDLMYAENKKEWGNLWGDNLNKKADAVYASLSDSEKKRFDDMAEGKALRYVVQMRQFIVQRAQTGAMERAIRKMLNLKSAYTLAELKNPFRVPRSRFDWDRLDKAIGKDAGQELRTLEAMKVLGIDVSTYQQFKQLNAPQSRSVPEEISATDSGSSVPLEQSVVMEKVVDQLPEGLVHFAPSGKDVKLDDLVGIEITKEPLKTWFAENVFVKLKPRVNYANHLEHHFHVQSAANLTWRMLLAMDQKLNHGVEYPPEYFPIPKKEEKAPAGDLPSRIEASGLTSVFVEIKLDVADAKVQRVIEDIIDAVDKGAFDPKTEEGRAEIKTFLEQEIH